MDQQDTNTDNNAVEVIKINHGNNTVSIQDSTTTEPVVPDQAPIAQQTTGIGSSNISSKYADEIKKIEDSYSRNIEDTHAQNFHAETQQASKKTRDLFSNEFQAPDTPLPQQDPNQVVVSQAENTTEEAA